MNLSFLIAAFHALSSANHLSPVHLSPALAPRVIGTLPKPSAHTLAIWQPAPAATQTRLLSVKTETTWQSGKLAFRPLLSRRKIIGTLSESSAQCMSTCAPAPGAPSHHVFIRRMIICLITCPMNPPERRSCRTALIATRPPPPALVASPPALRNHLWRNPRYAQRTGCLCPGDGLCL